MKGSCLTLRYRHLSSHDDRVFHVLLKSNKVEGGGESLSQSTIPDSAEGIDELPRRVASVSAAYGCTMFPDESMMLIGTCLPVVLARGSNDPGLFEFWNMV